MGIFQLFIGCPPGHYCPGKICINGKTITISGVCSELQDCGLKKLLCPSPYPSPHRGEGTKVAKALKNNNLSPVGRGRRGRAG